MRRRDHLEELIAELEASPAPLAVQADQGSPPASRVAVLPSAFNPPTLAHVALLQLAATIPGVTSTVAMLTTRNVAKKVHGASLVQRLEMLLAINGANPQVGVLACNAARLVDQAAALDAAFPDTGSDFVVGYDTLVRLFDPTYYDDAERSLASFFRDHRVIATNRGDFSIGDCERVLATPLARPFRDRVILAELDEHPASLSSTAARESMAVEGVPLAVPPEVEDYIVANGLYREP